MITKNINNQISFEASDIIAAFKEGEAEFVFLNSSPDEYGRTLCAKKWDDGFATRANWFFCMGYNEKNRTDIDADIVERALKQAQFKQFN